jgi:hypothetical protein
VKAAKDILICGSYKKLRTPETRHRPAERTIVTRWTTERVAPGAHAIILIDRAGWHVPTKLVVPEQHHARAAATPAENSMAHTRTFIA